MTAVLLAALSLLLAPPSAAFSECREPSAAPALSVLASAVAAAQPVSEVANRYVIPIPGERQFSDYDCGAAALLSVMDYYNWTGGDPNPRAFAREIGTTSKDGTSIANIVKAAASHEIPVQVKTNMTLASLERAVYGGKTWRSVKKLDPKQWLDAAHPVMVLYQAYGSENRDYTDDWADGHWSVVIGMDDDNVYLMDPSMNGKRSFIPREEFATRWHDVNDRNQGGAAGAHHIGVIFSAPAGVNSGNLVTATYGRYEYTP